MSRLKKILFVDDDIYDSQFHITYIKRLYPGVEIEQTSSSREALEEWEQWSENPEKMPQLVFLDMNMPLLKGHELLDKIKSLPDPHGIRERIKFVILSSFVDRAKYDAVLAKHADMVLGYFEKPLNEAILNQIFEKYFAD